MAEPLMCPVPTFVAGERRHGFCVLRVETIPEIRVTAYEIEHEKTGAKIIHLHCEDRENLYAIGFRTPPPDSTGVPHILEHSVLAGSERYPVKDAFSELHRGTLQTFINAFTYPDKTIYPIASQVRVDFFNLARVYTDLVLRPRLLKETFSQEGHHLEFLDHDDAVSDLTVAGIVYNEMKGAYSSPDALISKTIQEHLFPETVYAFDSGGDPDVIPSLTYEGFKNFHRLYYSPSNARFFLYGNIPTEDHLVFLEEMLAGFDKVEVDSTIGSQTRWAKPSSVHTFYPIGRDDAPQGKTTVTIAWMTTENTNSVEAFLLEIISGILVGNAAGPLRKALIDSGLGEDLSPITGLERDFKQIVFATGLRGTDPDKARRIEELIFDTLKTCTVEGFDHDLVEGTLQQVEFRGSEIVRNTFPYGINLMGKVYHTWLYGGDPFVTLNVPLLAGVIRKKWASEPDLFQKAVKTWLLDNPHRLIAITEPDRNIQQVREDAFRKSMASLRSGLSPAAREEVRREAARLKRFQMEPDSPEAVTTLPRLPINDIPKAIETIPTERTEITGVPLLVHDLFANGIAYLDVAFDVSDVPEDLQLYLPLLGKLLINMGAEGLSYDEMAKRIALKTGGMECRLTAGMTAVTGHGSWQKMIFRVRALHRNLADAVRIMADILASGDISDETRMRDVIAEAKNSIHAAVIPSGHIFARMTAGAALSISGLRDEQWHGRSQLQFLTRTAERFLEAKADLGEKFSRLKDMLFNKRRMVLNVTADTEGIAILRREIAGVVDRLGEGGHIGGLDTPALHPAHVGIAIPAQVSYVAKVLAAPGWEDPLAAPLFVAARHLSSSYLYKHIRVQGGAYGGTAIYDPTCGFFALLSYRDPHIVETLKVYHGAAEDITKNLLHREELEKAIIGAIGTLDRPMDPAHRGYMAMIREFAGLTDESRQAFRNGIIGMTVESVQEAAVRYFAEAGQPSAVAVYAAEEALSKANAMLEEGLAVEPLLL